MPCKQGFLQKTNSGLTLAELLIALALFGLLSLVFVEVFLKGSATSFTLNSRFKEVSELQSLVQDIQQDLRQGATISDNSHRERLEYTTINGSGSPIKKIYKITTISGKQYLQLSLDGGSSWISPYRISDYDKYILQNNPKFLYATSMNNCTDFWDSTGNGVWLSGSDAAGTYVACPNGTSAPVLDKPSQATKIDLYNFQFIVTNGHQTTTRALPAHLFINADPGLVRSTAAAVSPAVKDSPLIQKFDTATANSLFGTAFGIRQAGWDPVRERLILVGRHSSGNNKFFLADRRGVLINSPLSTFLTTIQADGVAVEASGETILVLDATAKYVYRFSIITPATLRPLARLNLASPTNLINNPTGIAYNPSTPSDFYIVGTDPSLSTLKIYQRNIHTGALVGTAWNLPAAFDVSHPPSGMTIDPVTGDFLVVRNYVNGSAPNQTIDIYRIDRGTGTSTSFPININDLGSTATGTTGNWGISYDAILNRLFLSDSATNKVYEVVPGVIISDRS
jgi:prepilin-type N-terminal cleavage/methylation domain-containing protein